MNWADVGPTLTLDALAEAARAVSLLPKLESAITVAPNVYGALQRRVPEMFRTLDVYEDPSLPASTWHKGKPRALRALDSGLV